MSIDIPILVHTNSDLSKLDFSFKDIFLYEISSQEFKDYIRSFDVNDFDNNYHFFQGLIDDEIHFDYQKYYAIVKGDFKTNFDYQEILKVHRILLVLFPSDLQILHEIHFHEFEGNLHTNGMSSWTERISGEYPGEYLLFIDEQIAEINEYIKLVFDRLKENSYLDITVFHYLTSFDASHTHYQYISLCMVLESAIVGDSELTYRLKRTIAVLLGNHPVSCRRIFSNLNKIYSLRSKIVHGEEYNHATMVSYMPYLKELASRVIIELLIHNFTKTSELNTRITELGYGDKNEITEGYKEFKLDILTLFHIRVTEL